MNPTNASNFPEDYQPNSDFAPTTTLHNIQWKCNDNSSDRTNYSCSPSFNASLGKTSELVAWCLMYSAISFLIIIGNALTIMIFRTNVQFSRRKENGFLLSLAIADMLVGVADVPLHVYLLVKFWSGVNLARYLVYFVFLTIDVLFGFASIFTLTAISLERLFSVIKPHQHRKVKKRTYWYLVRVPWGASALQSFLYLLSLKNILPFDVVFQFIVISLLCSMLVICIAYITIWESMTKRRQNPTSQTANLTAIKSELQLKKERKLTILVVIVTVAFALTWLPFQVINVVFYISYVNNLHPHISLSLIRFTKLLQYSNSMINPFIYSYNIKGFRRCLRRKIVDSLNLFRFRLSFQGRVKTNPRLNPKLSQKLSPKISQKYEPTAAGKGL
jgi:hypothetical protein